MGLLMHLYLKFQHTAARRRLGYYLSRACLRQTRFNTQPPEGGWLIRLLDTLTHTLFQHTAARRRLGKLFGGF